jgi:hypothetical protein
MLSKALVGLVGLAVAVSGVALFSAFTAQMVNLEAHVEKEIELAAVKNCVVVQGDVVCEEDTGDYGVVIPQQLYDKLIELTLSKSFFDQDRFFDVTFDVLWECKQDPGVDADGDGWEDCRVVNANPPKGNHPKGHNDPAHLDDYLRKYIHSITTADHCIKAAPGPNPSILRAEKVVEKIGSGVIDKLNKKCFYAIKLLAPPCADSFNPATDPRGPDVKTIECHFDKNGSRDPQDWERYADIGDEFKIQVTGHSLTP